MASLFGEMVHKNLLLRSECIQGVFEKLVTEYESQTERLLLRTTQEVHKADLLKEELEKPIYCALYL